MEREATIIKSASGLTNRVLGVVLVAARNATGTAIKMPSSVPRVAMLMVSQSGSQRLLM